jgi:hypothetical protein
MESVFACTEEERAVNKRSEISSPDASWTIHNMHFCGLRSSELASILLDNLYVLVP